MIIIIIIIIIISSSSSSSLHITVVIIIMIILLAGHHYVHTPLLNIVAGGLTPVGLSRHGMCYSVSSTAAI